LAGKNENMDERYSKSAMMSTAPKGSKQPNEKDAFPDGGVVGDHLHQLCYLSKSGSTGRYIQALQKYLGKVMERNV